MSATAVIALVALRRKPPHCSDIATAKAMAIFRNENSTDLAKKGEVPASGERRAIGAAYATSPPPQIPPYCAAGRHLAEISANSSPEKSRRLGLTAAVLRPLMRMPID